MQSTSSTRRNLYLALFSGTGIAIYQALFENSHTYDYYRPLFVFGFLFVTLNVSSWVANKGAK